LWIQTSHYYQLDFWWTKGCSNGRRLNQTCHLQCAWFETEAFVNYTTLFVVPKSRRRRLSRFVTDAERTTAMIALLSSRVGGQIMSYWFDVAFGTNGYILVRAYASRARLATTKQAPNGC
jgi:hypothetical protein